MKSGICTLSRHLYVHFSEVKLVNDQCLLTFGGERNAPTYSMAIDAATLDKLIDFLKEMKG